jgi:PBP1b-binding outer membrane lipoprotein LpoB
MKNRIALILLVASLFTGCGKGMQAEVEEVSRLQDSLKVARTLLEEIDSVAVLEAYASYDRNVRFLKQHYAPTTVDTIMAKTLAGYKAIKPVGRQLKAEMTMIRQELLFTETNLDALKQNIEAGTMNADTIKGYLDDENAAVTQLMMRIRGLNKSTVFALEMYRKHHPAVSELVASIDTLHAETE